MRIDSAFILFIIFFVAQLLFARKITRKIIKLLPVLVSVIGGIAVFASIFIAQNYYLTLLFIPIGLSFAGSITGLFIALLISKYKNNG